MVNRNEYKLNDLIVAFDAILDYYGMTDPIIRKKMAIVHNDPDKEQWVQIDERVGYDDLGRLFDLGGFETKGYREKFVTLLWLVANLYYGDNYYKAYQMIESSDEAIADLRYSEVRSEVLRFYIKVAEYEKLRNKAISEEVLWAEDWMKRGKSARAARKKEIIKQLEIDYGEIKGPEWKEIQQSYSNYADTLLDEEMTEKMRQEEDWKRLHKKVEDAEQIHLRFGDEKGFCLPNYDQWFLKLLKNHLFPWFIPDVLDVEDAKAKLRARSGRKPEDERLRAIVNGTANFFFDYEMVGSRTQTNLLDFLPKYLEMMGITCSDGSKPSRQKVEKLIEYLPNAETPSRFFSQDVTIGKGLHTLSRKNPQEVLDWLEVLDTRGLEGYEEADEPSPEDASNTIANLQTDSD